MPQYVHSLSLGDIVIKKKYHTQLNVSKCELILHVIFYFSMCLTDMQTELNVCLGDHYNMFPIQGISSVNQPI